MINIGYIINDPDFCQPFIAHRKKGSWVDGVFIQTEVTIKMSGVIIPQSSTVQQVASGDRVVGSVTFYSTQEIFTSHADNPSGTSDELEWHGDRYRINNVNDYSDYGFYSAVGTYLSRSK